MKINIISNYFPPDMGAASNRIYEMACGLQEMGNDVEVISPMPNYPEGRIFKGYRGKILFNGKYKEIPVRRSWLFATVSDSSILRLLSMFSFAFTMWFWYFHLLRRKPEYLIIQHSPLFVSLSATIMAKLLPSCKHVLNVSDLWPLSASELGAMKQDSFTYKVMEKIEKFNYLSSKLLIGQSQEILSYSREKYPIKETFLYRNIQPYDLSLTLMTAASPIKPTKIIYAGLLGVAQGIFAICESVDFRELEMEFHIYGDGNEREKIEKLIKQRENNIYYHGKVSREELRDLYPQYDAAIVPLATHIYGAVPSKIYELILFNIPILFSGSGEGASIINDNKLGFTSAPGDYEALKKNIEELSSYSHSKYQSLVDNCRKYAEEELDFNKQLQELDKKLKELN